MLTKISDFHSITFTFFNTFFCSEKLQKNVGVLIEKIHHFLYKI